MAAAGVRLLASPAERQLARLHGLLGNLGDRLIELQDDRDVPVSVRREAQDADRRLRALMSLTDPSKSILDGMANAPAAAELLKASLERALETGEAYNGNTLTAIVPFTRDLNDVVSTVIAETVDDDGEYACWARAIDAAMDPRPGAPLDELRDLRRQAHRIVAATQEAVQLAASAAEPSQTYTPPARTPPVRRSLRIVRAACGLIPAEHRDRYQSELVAELYDLPRSAQFKHALRILSRAVALRSALNAEMRSSGSGDQS